MNKAICWLRRDLRWEDNAALSYATQNFDETTVIFVFDTNILSKLPSKEDRRVQFIFESLVDLEKKLSSFGSSIKIFYGDPTQIIPKFAKENKYNAVCTNRDYEPYAKSRDEKVRKELKKADIDFVVFKDSVMFESHEVKTKTNGYYKVFTPYKNQWREVWAKQEKQVPYYQVNLKNLHQFQNKQSVLNKDWMKEIGFQQTENEIKGGRTIGLKSLKNFCNNKIDSYHQDRDFPIKQATSNLSAHIRFGTISIREMIYLADQSQTQGSHIWIDELIWRDFYQMILDLNPHITNTSFKPEYDQIKWPGTQKQFKAWVEGQTGFPIIDATMRCFAQTGLMHNRLRMVVASFLCKILHVNWRKGEEYFAHTLLDFDLAANNGGWQWSSSSGCDAQPYFRIFNPYTQSEKFDGNGDFIKLWCPELKELPKKYIHAPHTADMLILSEAKLKLGSDYPYPIVDYKEQREKCMDVYAPVKKS